MSGWWHEIPVYAHTLEALSFRTGVFEQVLVTKRPGKKGGKSFETCTVYGQSQWSICLRFENLCCSGVLA